MLFAVDTKYFSRSIPIVKRDTKLKLELAESNRRRAVVLERRNAVIYERWRAGDAKAQIARDYGLTRQRIDQIIARVGLSIATKGKK